MSADRYRVLIVDDNVAIHHDFAKILAPAVGSAEIALDAFEAQLFDADVPVRETTTFALTSAHQGLDGVAQVRAAFEARDPFALAFVDMRMPPGIDGLETIERMWAIDPDLHVVICSAYSDTTWDDLRERIGERDSLLILKKPFDAIEVVQIAHALAIKWRLARLARTHVEELEAAVARRTRELEAAEAELRLAQKLEAIGQLAAGIAHEINTPIQYVGDSAQFVRAGATDVVAAITELVALAAESPPDLVERLRALIDDHDLHHLTADLPEALDAIDTGVARVTKIVRAMRELAHPGHDTAGAVDLGRALHNALEVTAASYRYVADLEVDIPDLPEVTCFASDLNQVFVNLIVNAAHAMEDRQQRGRLTVRARAIGPDVVIDIADTGCGIPAAYRDRVFDAFFTTKEVGRGTGQGLAIAHQIVVDRHGGALTFDSKVGVGTTFTVRVPIAGRQVSQSRKVA